jgi:membrane associated rhomboid family serine protease
MPDSQNLEKMPDKLFRKKILLSLVVPGTFVIILWIIRFIEAKFGVDFSELGIYPMEISGLKGILFSPLIHSDIKHLFNNSLPILVLGSALFYFYSDVAFRVLAITWITTGILVWFAGRPAWHIGASGIVYSLASFLFVSGLIRRYFRLMALSLLVVFLYGSMVWGMFPSVNTGISWESHMLGAITGLTLAILYRKDGPVRPIPEWMLYDDDDDEDDSGDYSAEFSSDNGFIEDLKE